MAQKTIVELTDDLDGSTAVETLTFGLDGVDYEIDLSEDNARRLRDFLTEHTEAGRKRKHAKGTSVASAKRTRVGAGGDKTQNQAIREWARSQGREVADRGRIPSDLVDEYQLAHA